ncbi:CLUMA_CG012679, isoform B [Clunio marinus]|uniref:Oxidation resistance protein 1 n=1 Tax=Clunio marinus TaxID=568069 RepID=A0A1J1IGC4_9DIPT|nr:CLUMA_CG012679, isoform B [Clunio marinus]
MTSLVQPTGVKFGSNREMSVSTSPRLVSLEEENIFTPQRLSLNENGTSETRKYSDSNLPNAYTSSTHKQVKNRRSSLGLGLLGGKSDSNRNGKRRSSIAVVFLGRRQSKSKEATVEKVEKYLRKSSESDTENDPPVKITITPDYEPTMQEKKRRRSSSWATKMERRRRKGLPAMTGEIDYHGTTNGQHDAFSRQKRHSWWNIFVPENLKNRTRRSSQDVGQLSSGVEKFKAPPYNRSKSRSVDHGLAAPFDLDSLRSKVEGRFESIDRLSAKGPAPVVPTITYTVGDRDTLTSVAARFDTTPSELTALNRLGSSFIYSGQTLLVPDKSQMKDDDSSSEASGDTDGTKDKSRKSSSNTDDIPQQEKDLLDDLRPSSPKPGRIERINTPNQSEDDPVIVQRFLKLNVRHITDGQGVVGGVLLVTPNAVMFDPNVSDPLVIEHGPESYGVIAPMDFIVNAAIFNDIAHMRVGTGEYTSNTNEKPEVYHPKPCNRCDTHSPGKDSLLVKDETFPELGAGSSVDQESNCSTERDDGDAFPKAFDRDLVTPVERLHVDSTEGAATTETEAKKEEMKASEEAEALKSAEERRKSLLDQHWAIPSKDRLKKKYKCDSNAEDEDDQQSQGQVKEAAAVVEEPEKKAEKETLPVEGSEDDSLTRTSCHDSGIDIRDALPSVPIIPTKKVYSDADIVLSSDWVPPLTIAPASISTETRSQASSFSQDTVSTQSSEGRKKTSSVSFSVDENENQNSGAEKGTGEVKKSKMLKRLSYPLSWVEGLTGEPGKPETESAPNTSDSNQSVFSKVFSSSPITLVSEIGGNLFLSKTPSEDSGGSPIPPLPHDSVKDSSAGRSSIGTFIRSHPSSESSASSQSSKAKKDPPPKLDYRSMVSIDDMPALFVSFDKLIPRPARACQDPPMYLRLRMGRQIGKTTPLPTTVMSYGKNKLRPEYWFSIPKNKVDELYKFLNGWVAHIYGELDEEALKSRGFELIQHDTEWANNRTSSKDGGDISGEIGEYTRESWEYLNQVINMWFIYITVLTGIIAFVLKKYGWNFRRFGRPIFLRKIVGKIRPATPPLEDKRRLSTDHSVFQVFDDGTIISSKIEKPQMVLSMSKDDYRNASYITSGSFDQDFPIPDLIGSTEILSEDHREKLCSHLPARAEGYSWSLVFSTSQHGFSLNSLYRKMHKLESPILIVIEDTQKNVFGALTSCSLHVSDHFYGTGESLLYKFNPSFKVFHWSGENLYFIKGNPESLAIGAGDGKFGLWLDGDLNQGRSQHCSTYSNEPLAPEEDFVIKTLECWAFV